MLSKIKSSLLIQKPYVFCFALQHENLTQSELRFALHEYLETNYSTLLIGLACSRSSLVAEHYVPALLHARLDSLDILSYLKEIDTNSLFGKRRHRPRSQVNDGDDDDDDEFGILQTLAKDMQPYANSSFVWKFVVSNWQSLFERFGAKSNFFLFLVDVAGTLNSHAECTEAFEFLTRTGLQPDRIIDFTDRIRAKHDWIDSHGDTLNKWLDRHQPQSQQQQQQQHQQQTSENNSSSVTSDLAATVFHLPTHLRPFFYELTIRTHADLAAMTRNETTTGSSSSSSPLLDFFDGRVVVHFVCDESTDLVVLHALGLNISSASIVVADLNESLAVIGEPVFDKKTDFVTFRLSKACLPRHNYSLRIDYTGPIYSHEMAGLYKSSYKLSNGSTVR